MFEGVFDASANFLSYPLLEVGRGPPLRVRMQSTLPGRCCFWGDALSYSQDGIPFLLECSARPHTLPLKSFVPTIHEKQHPQPLNLELCAPWI